ncbi:MAG: serine/threonine protein kinase [Burkholderiales bacterium]|nr:serine/threonine protein kinase [Burkholderiales bacterium]
MPTVAEHDALPAGTRLGEFEIERVLGVGGFGIVYLAFDHALERQVAIKEYMPAALSARGRDLNIVLRSVSHAETFALGLRSFINEARLLARFDHPALVKVYRFWEDHGTAYMVMPYYRGRTVQRARSEMKAPPDEAWLRQLIEPVLGALDCLHREQVFHRDIAPDNILLLEDEEDDRVPRPVLLDLGAARHVIGDRTQSLTAILKPSFAPIEQYAETAQLRQGAWTDLYALAAVVHFCITGRPPTPATARAVHDDLSSLGQMSDGLASGFDRVYSRSFINAIDHALAVRPQDRPDSVGAWRQELSGIVSVDATRANDPGRQAAKPADSGPLGPLTDQGWLSNTVLVRPPSGEKPVGHEAIEEHAYLTTIPAASALRTRPTWTARAMAPGSAPAEEASLGPAAAAGADKASRGPVRRWWWAGAVVVATVALSAGWMQQRHQGGSAAALVQHFGTATDIATTTVPLKPVVPVLKPASSADPERATPARQRVVSPTETEARKASPAIEEALSPQEACGGRNFISRAICMKRRCSRPEYAAHPDCQRMRQQEGSSRLYP